MALWLGKVLRATKGINIIDNLITADYNCTVCLKQRMKKSLSDRPGLVNFSVGLVVLILGLPTSESFG